MSEDPTEQTSLLVRRSSSVIHPDRTYGFAAQSKRVEHWEVADVIAWLSTLEPISLRTECRVLLPTIVEQDINGVALLRVTEAHLESMGLARIGSRLQLLSEVEALKRISWVTVIMESILPSGSVSGAVFNLCSAMLGAGALSLPYAFANAGIVDTALMLFLTAVATIYTIHLLIYVFESRDTRTYEDPIADLVGSKLAPVVEVFSILFCFGTAVAYVVVLGDSLTLLTTWLGFAPHRKLMMVLFWGVFMLPPSCLKHIDSLRISSFIGVLSMFYISFAVTQLAIQEWNEPQGEMLTTFDWGTCTSMPIVVFTFSCQVNVWPIYEELKASTKKQKRSMMMRASYGAVTISLLAYCIIGYFGYRYFGQRVDGNVLTNFPPSLAPIGGFCMVVSVITAFPMNFYPMRQSINQLFYGGSDRLEKKGDRRVPVLQNNADHFLQTLLWCVLILLLGIFVPNVSFVFQLVGSLITSTLCFILPAYLVLLVDRQNSTTTFLKDLVQGWYRYAPKLGLIVCGILVSVLGTIVTLT
eukprot:NODE_338_length_1767_cov_328.221769_g274_i0.p1 GENE.NODE_338_length_1767_cov_328.221769_g274_i0~~NODE_338_length_1767_cov_328.221769_g274_i0.p1  ORF type:complete len:548 (-),score=115.74 NODE_338_length_1767_cov_328.221769_g274_i0:122-1702(-)